MKNGTVAETGTHEELMLKNSEYAKLYNIQASAFLPEASSKEKMEIETEKVSNVEKIVYEEPNSLVSPRYQEVLTWHEIVHVLRCFVSCCFSFLFCSCEQSILLITQRHNEMIYRV